MRGRVCSAFALLMMVSPAATAPDFARKRRRLIPQESWLLMSFSPGDYRGGIAMTQRWRRVRSMFRDNRHHSLPDSAAFRRNVCSVEVWKCGRVGVIHTSTLPHSLLKREEASTG